MASEAALNRLVAEHRAAVGEFLGRVEQVAPGRWNSPRSAGKWTPGQEVTHVILAYEAFIRDLRDGQPMRLVGTPVRRFVWRMIGLTSIVHFKRIPVAARAPRESRPPEGSGTPAELVEELRDRVSQFESIFTDAWHRNPGKRLTHPYFGAMSLRHSMTMITVHTRHHAAFLEQSASRPADAITTDALAKAGHA